MSLKEDATTVAVLKALRDIVDAEYEAARQRVFAGLCEVRDETGLKSIRVTLPDDTPVATISLIDPKPAIAVSDEKAFLGWVREYYPSEVETLVRVRPAWQRNFISGLDASSDLVTDASTGENVRGLDAVPAPGTPTQDGCRRGLTAGPVGSRPGGGSRPQSVPREAGCLGIWYADQSDASRLQ
jgi:hypothetical protein